MQDTEKSWEYAHEYVKKIEQEAEAEYGTNKYAAMTGTLQGTLSSLFIGLSVYHPEAFSFVLKRMELTQ